MAEQKSFILHVKGPESSWDFTIPVGTAVVGREAGVELQLPYPLVSRKHARFECTVTQCTVTDLGSANGTLVNGTPIEPNTPTEIAHGDRLDVGPFEITVEVMIKADMPEAEAAPPPPEAEAPAEKPAAEKAARPAKAPKASAAGAKPHAAQEKPSAKKPAAPEPAAEAAGEPPVPPPPVTPADISPESVGPDVIPPEQLPPGITIHSRRLLPQLPGIYHTDFMSRFLGLFEATLLPIEWTVDHFDLFLSPGTSPYAFLPWLANWYEIVFDATWSEAQRRTLLGEAHEIYARRGTRWALSRVLEIYLGQAPDIQEFQDAHDPYTFTIKLPVRSGKFSQELIERIVDASKPAHTNYILQFKN